MRTVALVLLLTSTTFADDPLLFNRDVRQILAEHCWNCHGPDAAARQSNLRLDTFNDAVLPAESGQPAIVPKKPQDSELVRRIQSSDATLRMPPDSAQKPLTATQIDILKRWISGGATFQKHWSFEPIVPPVVPDSPEIRSLLESSSAINPIDAFVAESLAKQKLRFSPEAPREALLRRVTVDLTGLPPTADDLARTNESYEEVVDRLLHSSHFGERMAVDWLDAARYADTNGYFSDKPRQIWLWRDWVIRAFNDNMPFDQFTVEQLAGDLLPAPTIQQRIATGFNRNHVSNNETGIIDEEFRTEYVVDRVDTTMTTWLGLTIGCAQCHDHKYDPISQQEFYQLFAFFNNVPEKGLIVTDDPPPVMKVSTPELDTELANLSQATTNAAQAFEPIRLKLATEISTWEPIARQSIPLPPQQNLMLHEAFDNRLGPETQAIGTTLTYQTGIRAQAALFDATQHASRDIKHFDADGPWTIGLWLLPDNSLSCPLSKIEPEGDRTGVEVLWQKGRINVNLVAKWGTDAIEVTSITPAKAGQWHHVAITYDGSKSAAGLKLFLDGHPLDLRIDRDSLTSSVQNDRPILIGRRDSGLGYYGQMDELRILQQALNPQAIEDWHHGDQIHGILERPTDTRSARDTETLMDFYIARHTDEKTRAARNSVKVALETEIRFRNSIPSTLVMEEMPQPRETHVLIRGQYDQPGQKVEAGTPTALSSWPETAPKNRLGLARWLMDPANPLTARVAVNRLWKQCFGEGLVRTPNDFGSQGEPPTHPELLDWLAATYRDNGWNTKDLLRLIVTSRTYRQSSDLHANPSTGHDLQNRLLSRNSAFRMSAEMIRDQALAASGLLRPKIGGPSVKPYQPAGLWEEVSYNSEDSYEESNEDGLWRRSLYTYLKRQVPPPSLLAFDGTPREKCTVQRARTNTPIQALILLNDPTYLEAARVLANSVLLAKTSDEERLVEIFRRILSRNPEPRESTLLLDLLKRQRDCFQTDPAAADKLLQVGVSRHDDSHAPTELAAWTMTAHTLLNLDEAITRR
jgi:hypothetical protein